MCCSSVGQPTVADGYLEKPQPDGEKKGRGTVTPDVSHGWLTLTCNRKTLADTANIALRIFRGTPDMGTQDQMEPERHDRAPNPFV